MSLTRILVTLAGLVSGGIAAHSASLQVEPALVDVKAPGAAATITLRNGGDVPIAVQVRVFRWSQADGKETLEPTQDVVASPPAISLVPDQDYVARIVRVDKRPVIGEESYRLLIDELPGAARARQDSVRLLVRHSVPVFFGNEASPATVSWSISRRGGQVVLSATNSGESRLRLSALSLNDASGKRVSLGKGLVGYALGGSTMSWAIPNSGRSFAAKGSATVTATGNDGTINAVAPVTSNK